MRYFYIKKIGTKNITISDGCSGKGIPLKIEDVDGDILVLIKNTPKENSIALYGTLENKGTWRHPNWFFDIDNQATRELSKQIEEELKSFGGF